MEKPVQFANLINKLIADESIVVVTANRRLANFVQSQFDAAQLANNKQSWPTPTILPLTTWLETCWLALLTQPLNILTAFQELIIWQRIIDDSKLELINSLQTAKLAKQAWGLLQQWQLSLDDLVAPLTEECTQFRQWAQQFQDYCQQHALCSTTELPQQLLKQKDFNWPGHIITLGFTEFAPIYQTLFQHIATTGTVTHWQNNQTAQTYKVECQHNTQELDAVFRWATLKSKTAQQQRYAIVIPELEQQRQQIEDLAKRYLSDYQLPGESILHPTFNMSASSTLYDYTVIRHAFDVLNLNQPIFRFDELSHLWQSPYLTHDDDEQNIGALIDKSIRELDQFELTRSHVAKCIAKISQQHYSSWPQRWHAFHQHIKTYPANQPPSAWAVSFSELLTQIGWPGNRPIASVDYQVLNRWQQLLHEFAGLDTVCPSLDYQRALYYLKQLAMACAFQIQTADAPIQILGLLEATGLCFDAMWIVNLHADNWPSTPKPNPLLPIELQRQHAMPHSSAARELAYTKQLMQLLQQSNHTLIMSYALNDQAQRFLPSPLLNPLKATTLTELIPEPTESYLDKLQQRANLENYQDPEHFVVDDTQSIKGGSWIITQQALCPFRAFATIRLHADPIPEPTLGISAQQRGILTHSALERFWQQQRDQKTLHSLSDQQLHEQVTNIVTRLIHEQPIEQLTHAGEHLQQLEQQHLINTVYEWLIIEKQRPEFTVLACEIKHHAQFAGLNLQLKIDRIDQLNDGKHLIIDYKTGTPSILGWFDERLTDPQLPIYCVSINDSQLAGLCYAQVKPGNMQFRGMFSYAAEEQCFSNLKPFTGYANYFAADNWQALLNHWQQSITQIANEFIQGIATVDPVDGACDHCHLHALCRIQPC